MAQEFAMHKSPAERYTVVTLVQKVHRRSKTKTVYRACELTLGYDFGPCDNNRPIELSTIRSYTEIADGQSLS